MILIDEKYYESNYTRTEDFVKIFFSMISAQNAASRDEIWEQMLLGRNQRANRPAYWGGFGPPKTVTILPIVKPRKK